MNFFARSPSRGGSLNWFRAWLWIHVLTWSRNASVPQYQGTFRTCALWRWCFESVGAGPWSHVFTRFHSGLGLMIYLFAPWCWYFWLKTFWASCIIAFFSFCAVPWWVKCFLHVRPLKLIFWTNYVSILNTRLHVVNRVNGSIFCLHARPLALVLWFVRTGLWIRVFMRSHSELNEVIHAFALWRS